LVRFSTQKVVVKLDFLYCHQKARHVLELVAEVEEEVVVPIAPV
jgi:hypothetical protein